MTTTSRSIALPVAGFGAATAAIYATAITIVASPLFARAPRLGPAAVTIDLIICVPVLYWLLVVRRGGVSVWSVVPVYVLSMLAARLVLPAGDRQWLQLARMVFAPAEMGLVGWAGYRAWRLLRNGRARRPGVLEAIRAAVGELVRVPRAADVVAAEVALFWYALLSWRARPEVAPGEVAFTAHRRSGMGGVLGAIVMACAGEAAAVHLLLAGRSPALAWVLTGLSVYSMVWLVGLGRAVALRPTVVDGEVLRVRAGVLWEAVVPVDSIERVTVKSMAGEPKRAPGYLHAAFLTAPQVRVDLREPVDAVGLYGQRRRGVRTIGIFADEPAQLAAALSTA